MAAANVSPRRLRAEVLSSPLTDFRGYRLAVDCATQSCDGERIHTIVNLIRIHRRQPQTVDDLVARLRCCVCGRPPAVVILETGPDVATRGRMRRLSLRGRELMQPDRNW
jgi:hypothetical protein